MYEYLRVCFCVRVYICRVCRRLCKNVFKKCKINLHTHSITCNHFGGSVGRSVAEPDVANRATTCPPRTFSK